MTLEEKLEELTSALSGIHKKLALIHLDTRFLNDNNREYQDAMSAYISITKRIWALKQAWGA